MMRILQIHNFYQIPGGECAVVRAEKTLLESAGHRVGQFTLDSSGIHAFSPAEKVRMLSRIPWNRSILPALQARVKQFRPDVAHVHNLFPLLSPSVYAGLHRSGVPVVQTHHNFRMLCPNGLFFINGRICEACQKSLFACAKRKCVRGSLILSVLYALAIHIGWRQHAFNRDITRHIALNPFFRSKLIYGGVPEADIRLCGNFVSKFAPQVAEKGGYFFFLGRLSPEKGLMTFLEAARRAGVPVKIAGTGPLEADIRRFIAAHRMKRVQMVGFVTGSEKAELIAKSRAVVFPSHWYENYPIAAVEALAMGTPILASDIGGLPAIVDHDKTGYLFRSGDAGELADLMRKLDRSQDLVRQLSACALQTAKDRFSPENHLRLLLGIYTEAIQASTG